MTAVIGMIDLSLAAEQTLEGRDYLETAKASASSLLELLNDILDLTRLEAGRLEPRLCDFNLDKLVRSTVQTLAVEARRKNLDLLLDLPPDLPSYLHSDPGRLRQVLINLIGNSIKFTEKGQVSLKVLTQEAKADRIVLQFTVADTGIGIPAEGLGRIFEPFTQADSSTTRHYGGTGLGTTIAKQLVELMGGEIWVESQAGEGSRFYFTWPSQPARGQVPVEEEEVLAPPAEGIAPAPRRLKILLAEDNPVNQKLVQTLLEKRGHQVNVAADGAETVKAWAAEEFDLILMDVQMPGLDGYEATSAIRAREAGTGRRTPIVALTAHAMKGDRESCLEAGMDDYLAKPINPDQLFEKVERWAAKRGLSTHEGSGVDG